MEEPKEVRIKFEDEPAPGCISDSDNKGIIQFHKDIEKLDLTGDNTHHGDIKDWWVTSRAGRKMTMR